VHGIGIGNAFPTTVSVGGTRLFMTLCWFVVSCAALLSATISSTAVNRGRIAFVPPAHPRADGVLQAYSADASDSIHGDDWAIGPQDQVEGTRHIVFSKEPNQSSYVLRCGSNLSVFEVRPGLLCLVGK
jgi:hypothetical protein